MLRFLAIAVLLQPTNPAHTVRVYDQRSGKPITVAALAEQLSRRDVVFLGEDHDNPVGHRIEREIIEALYRRRPDMVISMEMFERDVQGVLTDYLHGQITESVFLKHSRPWSNYKHDYRPIIEFAREHRLDVIAANAPHRVAMTVAKRKPSAYADRPFLPRTTTAPQDAYWERFVEKMAEHTGTNRPSAMRDYYKSQCLKDDTMAESITDYLSQHSYSRPRLVVHLCGSFHSDYGGGTVLRVLTRRPLLQIAVLSMQAPKQGGTVTPATYRNRCHFLLVLPSSPKKKDRVPDKPKSKEKK